MTVTRYDSRPALARPAAFFGAALADLRRAGPIVGLLLRNNLRVRHRKAMLGYLWIVLPPLLTAAVFAFLRARQVAVFGDTQLPYFLFVLAGMCLWQVFVDALNMPLRELQSGRQLLARTMVPHEALVVAGMLEVLVNAAIRLAVLALALLVAGAVPHVSALLLPLGVLALMVLGTAIGWLLAPLGLLYDDVRRAMNIAIGLLFFLTPIIYPAPTQGWLTFNPVAPLLVTSRGWLTGPADAGAMIGVSLAALVLLVFAWLGYRLARPHLQARL